MSDIGTDTKLQQERDRLQKSFDEMATVPNFYGYAFRNTCCGCPEQYNMINGRGRVVGYVRLRYGFLRVDDRLYGKRGILTHQFPNELMGIFDDNDQRLEWLQKAAHCLRKVHKRVIGR